MTALWLAASLLASASPDECREAYAAVDYRKAAQVCVSVLATAPRGELPGLYKLAGLSLAALGDAARAHALFLSLLALEPGFELDASLSPRLREPFDLAKSERAGRAVKLIPRTQGVTAPGQPLVLVVDVDDGPGRPVQRVRSSGVTVERADPTRLALAAPPPGVSRVEVSAVDEFGAELATVALTLDLTAPAPAPPPRSTLASWKLWTAVGAVALVGAVGLGVGSRLFAADAASAHFASDGDARLQTARMLAISADVGFALAGCLGVLALVLGLTE